MKPASTQMSLRERNKLKRQAQIIQAARTLFNSRGYSSTRLDEVADLAEVGIATVHNYFGTKLGLLAAVLRKEFAELDGQSKDLLKAIPSEPLRDVLALIDIYYQLEDSWQASDVLRQVMGPGFAASPELDEIAAEAERQVQAGFRSILSGHQELGKIRPEVNLDDATQVLFSIFNQEFYTFISGQWDSFEEMRSNMDRLIGFVISSIESHAAPGARKSRRR
jgi:AcrR family transcriptional regulator